MSDRSHFLILGDQDDILLALSRPGEARVTAQMIAKLPPWRATMIAKVVERCGVKIEGWTAAEIHAQAVMVGGNGTLTPPKIAPTHPPREAPSLMERHAAVGAWVEESKALVLCPNCSGNSSPMGENPTLCGGMICPVCNGLCDVCEGNAFVTVEKFLEASK